jgi:hypothetical protein
VKVEPLLPASMVNPNEVGCRRWMRAMGEFGSDATRQVVREGWPILLVTRGVDDGAWQLVNGDGDTDDTDSAMVVALAHVAALDRSLGELAGLPLGWRARRETVDRPWRLEPR